MAPGEKEIGCFGTSSWCKVLACCDFVASILLLISSINLLANGSTIIAESRKNLPPEMSNEKAMIFFIFNYAYQHTRGEYSPEMLRAGAIIFVLKSLLGLAMGVVLLKGTSQKRVGFLKTYNVYQIVCIVLFILGTVGQVIRGIENIPALIFGLVGIGWTVLGIYVVSTHKKEINAGVFSRPVNLSKV